MQGEENLAPAQLTVVANRLPVELRDDERWTMSPGGLVAALEPVLRDQQCTWVGWSGTADVEVQPFTASGMTMAPVTLSSGEVEDYYHGMSNATLWPLFHDRIHQPSFHRHWWRSYQLVNDRFARAAARAADYGGSVWVHDYQLALVPAQLRALRPDVRIGFFLHVPFPPLDLVAQLPWRRQIVAGLLGADSLGFQTKRDARKFRTAALEFSEARPSRGGVTVGERRVRIEASPIGIDTAMIDETARRSESNWRVADIRKQVDGRRLFLGIDRLDYTKGIVARLRAFETLLERRPELAEQSVFLQVAVPSREATLGYAETRNEIEGLVGSLNGRFGRFGRVPLQYRYDTLELDDLVAHYRAADVMVVTPPRDGMNLVAMEFVASRIRNQGVLVLSEFAGAAHLLRQALLVNPNDIDGVADAYERALDMSSAEQQRRMRLMRASVRQRDVHAWARNAFDAMSAGAVPPDRVAAPADD